ncbi:MAG TPA: FHA domain-containing protein [Intrasporangium sp.]|uniref:FHA domain-containing protein n=1 Tax=Intrasporangium sp. TaxID=1925024 RepID=UPI002F9387C2
MTDPSVVVQRAPDGWTHIGGPGMHLLIGLEEDDDRTLTASDAADGGQLDDVIDVLTIGGPRKAHHFVGVHWRPRTRVVAFGPVSARLTMADGTEHEVRALNPRVWTDLVLDTYPERVELRVLEDTEASEPAPAPTLVGGPGGVAVVSAEVRPPEPPSQSSQQAMPPPTRALPTFGAGLAESAEAAPSPWDRSWSTPTESASAPALPSWGPGPAVLPRRVTPLPAAAAESPPPMREAAPVLPDLSVAHSGPADVESTWAVKPTPTEDERRTSQSDEAATPSYDYLFGHTVTVDEHRQLLADVESAGDGEPDPPEVPAPSPPPPPSPPSPSPSTTPAPVPPTTPTTPATATPASPTPPTGGGLISSVPWASGAASANPDHGATPESRPEVPSFSGRHTPPPAPSLLPPAAQPVVPPVAPVVEDLHAHLHVDADELTVDRSALIDARLSAQSGASGPSVVAVLCSQGHPTPPHGDSCRICGGGIPPQNTFTMPRPPLGTLRLSTGDVVTLDRSVLMGRAPMLGSDLAATDRPHVVKVPSPERDVSRNHVEVVLEGWHVLIRDLGTTNGTTVALPGGQPVRLRANDQQVLEPGSVVAMADEVSFVFDPGTS